MLDMTATGTFQVQPLRFDGKPKGKSFDLKAETAQAALEEALQNMLSHAGTGSHNFHQAEIIYEIQVGGKLHAKLRVTDVASWAVTMATKKLLKDQDPELLEHRKSYDYGTDIVLCGDTQFVTERIVARVLSKAKARDTGIRPFLDITEEDVAELVNLDPQAIRDDHKRDYIRCYRMWTNPAERYDEIPF